MYGFRRRIGFNSGIKRKLQLSPITEVRWVAPSAQGTGDGSTSSNAAPRTLVNTLIQQIVATGRAGVINFRTDLGTYGTLASPISGSVAITSGYSGSGGFTIVLRGSDAAGGASTAQFVGSRTAAPTTSTSGPYLWALGTGVNNILFEDMSALNVRGFLSCDAVSAYNIGASRIALSNCYRGFSLDWSSNYNNPAASRVNGLYLTDCSADYVAQALLVARNARGLYLTRCSANGHGVNQYGNDPAGINIAPSFGTTTTSDTSDFIVIDGFISTGLIMAYTGQFIQGDGMNFDDDSKGDGMNFDDDSTGPITSLSISGLVASLCGDAGLDTKGQSGEYNKCVSFNNYIGSKCWARAGYTANYTDYCSVNMCVVPGTEAGAAKARQHLYMLYSDVTVNLNGWTAYEWPSSTKFPKLPVSVANAPSEGATILPGSAACLIRGNESKTGQTVNVNGWDRISCVSGLPFFLRDGTGSPTSGVTINFSPPLPVVSASVVWRSGFSGGFVPEGTAVGTTIADISFTHDQTSGVAACSVVSDPDGVFAIVGNEVRLASALSAATSASHSATLRAVYGIVGTDTYNNASDPTTWACHLGFMLAGSPACYVDINVIMSVMGTEEAETTSFFNAASADGIDISVATPQWRAAVNGYVKALKDSGVWSIADVLPLNLAPSTALALRSLKNTYHAAITGGVSKTPKTLWASDGTTGYLSWTTFAPNGAGLNWSQNSASVMVESVSSVTTTNQIFSMGSGSSLTSLSPASTSTTASYRVNNQNMATSTSTTTGVGIWTLTRTGSTSQSLRQNDVARGTNTNASVALTSGIPRLFTNTGVTTFAAHQGGLWGLTSALSSAQVTAFRSAILSFKSAVNSIP